MSRFSIIILSKDHRNLMPCVEAVRKHEPHARIIVVNDGLDLDAITKTDDCFLCANDPIELVDGVKPFVYARNVNIGIAKAVPDDVILLNDDALLKTPGGFSAMQRAAVTHPEYGVIGATTNCVGNPNQHPQGVGLRFEPRMVCFVCALIPRFTLDLVGPLDERFIGYGFEDDAYCLEVRRAGRSIGIYDGCYVDHASLRSTFRGDPLAPADLTRNERIFREKYGAGNWQV